MSKKKKFNAEDVNNIMTVDYDSDDLLQDYKVNLINEATDGSMIDYSFVMNLRWIALKLNI